MFHALAHHPGLTQVEHRTLPFVSNTNLTNLKNELLSLSRQLKPVILAYGTHFHTAVLEPPHYARTAEHGIQWADLEQLAH